MLRTYPHELLEGMICLANSASALGGKLIPAMGRTWSRVRNGCKADTNHYEFRPPEPIDQPEKRQSRDNKCTLRSSP